MIKGKLKRQEFNPNACMHILSTKAQEKPTLYLQKMKLKITSTNTINNPEKMQ